MPSENSRAARCIRQRWIYCKGGSPTIRLKRSAKTERDKFALYEAEKTLIEKHFTIFDTLDFEAYSKQNWPLFDQIHGAHVRVVNADGTITNGIEQHNMEMLPMFAAMPDLKITEHPVKVGQGDWTAVIGNISGTFTQPMPVGPDTSIPPTGKHMSMQMATFAHWENGQISEEILFMNMQEMMSQMGVGQ